ncbi:MAG: class I SAM-dependent methyltransferase [Planctomycetota bacterium]|nr:class I SAM-dependent methyltransferase [Planctomycetota bacterium]
MEEELFDAIHANAERHWWFRGRQKIALSLLDRFYGKRGAGARVLDLGCGVGNNLKALEPYGEVWGADPSEKALAYCRQRFTGRLDEVWLPDKLPYEEKTFDLVVMLDVLEHVEDDVGALQRVLRILKPGGTYLLTVPALRWLWSYHDVEHHHFRRYHRGDLRRKLTRLGFEVPHISYINFLLLPAMGMARMMLRPKTWSARDLQNGTGAGGRLLERIFRFERHMLWLGTLPIGGSLVAVARRPQNLELPPWRKGDPLPTRRESKHMLRAVQKAPEGEPPKVAT